MARRPRLLRIGLLFSAAALCAPAALPASAPDPLDAVARDVAATEEVYARHRSGGPAAVSVPLANARARAADALAKSRALEALWGLRVGNAALQAELDRMARTSRDPDLLRELFEALDDDPARIAEALVRPRLVESILRPRYARDARLHAGTRERAAQLIAGAARSGDFYAVPGFHLDTWRLDPVAAVDPREAERWLARGVIVLGEEAWEVRVRQLAVELGIPVRTAAAAPLPALIAELPLARPTGLSEEDESFEAEVLLGAAGAQLTVGHARFEKTPFEGWWRGAKAQFVDPAPAPLAPAPSVDAAPLRLPEVGESPCEDDTWTSPLQVEPRGRWRHVAAWTGSEMILWGGRLSDEIPIVLGDGARYDPVTDGWMPISSEGAPSPRSDALAVWTGSELIVWGGRGAGWASPPLPDGAIYDPALDQWHPIASTSIPLMPAYGMPTAVWTGTEVVFYGSDAPTGARYRPDIDAWFPISIDAAPQIPGAHTAVWTGTEMIVWGGDGWQQHNGGRYDPATDAWRGMALDDRVLCGDGHTAVWTGSEMIVWGGRGIAERGGAYDPVADTWRPVRFGDAAYAHTAVWTGTEMIVWGGWWGQCYSNDWGYRYDPVTDVATYLASAGRPIMRGYHTAVWTGSEMIVWGGEHREHSQGQIGLSSGARYDPATDSWTPTRTSGAPLARTRHTTTWTGAEMIVWGGGHGYLRCADGDWARKSGGRYEPATNAWLPTAEPATLTGRMEHAAVWTGERMVVWGGREGLPREPTAAPGTAYDPALDAWGEIASENAPQPRAFPTAAWTGREMILWGGIAGWSSSYPEDAVATGGRYDPQLDRWLPITPQDAPSARLDHTAAWTGTEMIVWGGRGPDGVATGGASYHPDTGTWSPVSEEDAPLSCTGHAAAWTGSEILVAGCADPPALYDPQLDAWRPTSTAGAPAPGCGGQAHFTGQEVLHWCPAGGTRYEPASDTWRPISTQAAPVATAAQRPAWSGTQMLVWGAASDGADSGAYCAQCTPRPWYPDPDGDGFGVEGEEIAACRAPEGTVAAPGDCAPLEPAVHPGAAEMCNAIDDDCDGEADEEPDAGRNCPETSLCAAGSCPEGACLYGPSGLCPVTGSILYYRDVAGHEPAEPPIGEAGVTLALTGASSGEATSGAVGGFDFGPRFWEVTVTPRPRLDAESSPFVTSYDALLAAKATLGWIQLTPLQRRAAEVSGDGRLSFFDAALIAQYSVGLLVPVGYPDPDPARPRGRFPAAAAAGSDWLFAPAARSVFLDHAAPAPLDFSAIQFGEVSGRRVPWDEASQAAARAGDAASARSIPARPSRAAPPEGATLALRRVRTSRAAGGSTTLLLSIRPATGIVALEIGVDPGVAGAGLLQVAGRGELLRFETLVDPRPSGGSAGLYAAFPVAGDEGSVEITLAGRLSSAQAREALRVVANEGRIPLRWKEARRENTAPRQRFPAPAAP